MNTLRRCAAEHVRVTVAVACNTSLSDWLRVTGIAIGLPAQAGGLIGPPG
jgi:hypothetical protein